MRIEIQNEDPIEIPDSQWLRKDMRNLELHRAIFSKMTLKEFLFDGSDLRSALFDLGVFQATSFYNVRAMNAVFLGSDLREANFKNARIIGAVFDGADLRGVDFDGADAAYASFAGCDLRGANLKFSRSFEIELQGARLDSAAEFRFKSK